MAAPSTGSSPAAPDGDRLLTVKDLAAMLGVDPRTVHNWRCRGEGPPAAAKLPKQVLFRQADVNAWLAARPDPLAGRNRSAKGRGR